METSQSGGNNMAIVGGFLTPLTGQITVFFDTVAVVIGIIELILRFGIALFSELQVMLKSSLGISLTIPIRDTKELFSFWIASSLGLFEPFNCLGYILFISNYLHFYNACR